MSVVTVAAPVIVLVPPVTEVEVREPAETVPPEMLAPRAPTTVTVPAPTPPVMSASLPNRVEPAPASEARMILPLVPEKLSELAVVLALVTAPLNVRPVPDTVAEPVALSVSVAAAL